MSWRRNHAASLMLGVALEFTRIRAVLGLESVPSLSQHLQHQLRLCDGARTGEAWPPDPGPPWRHDA